MEKELGVNQQIQDCLWPHLMLDDDKEFWLSAMDVLLKDVEAELETIRPKDEVYAQIGACSHWLRPHQTRWAAAGGFAWPVGYGNSGHSRGLPEFDWFVLLRRDFENRSWHPVDKIEGKRTLIFRAALPTRTNRHSQAAVNTLWFPKRPSDQKPKAMGIYGFRKIEGMWQCLANR